MESNQISTSGSEHIFLHMKKGDIIKCQNLYCSEIFTVYNSGNLYSMKCPKCTGNWTCPGKPIPALSYTSCKLCTCQFMVEKLYRGTNPMCKKCRLTKEQSRIPEHKGFPNREKPYCECCKLKKSDATFDVNPFNFEIYGDDKKVWMCKECRFQSYMDV